MMGGISAPGDEHFEGSFSFQSLVARLMRNDLRPGGGSRSVVGQDVRRALRYAVESQVDCTPLQRLPPELDSSVSAKLFHERFHYWQCLSSPLQHYRFIYRLEALRGAVQALGGRPRVIVGRAMWDRVFPEHAVRAMSSFLEKNFSSGNLRPEAAQVEKLPTELPTFHAVVPVTPSDQCGRVHGAVLGFSSENITSTVPFLGVLLLESAAYLAQALFEGRPLPTLEPTASPNDARYIGCWEFWRRFVGAQYADDEALALSYLASVDLTMLLNLYVADDDVHGELASLIAAGEMPDPDSNDYFVPHRFWKVAVAAKTLMPLEIDSDGPAEAVAAFQSKCCEVLGWQDPCVTAGAAAVALTRVLVNACDFYIEWREASRSLRTRLFTEPAVNLGNDPEVLRPIWNDLGRGDLVFGKYVLGKMLDALLDRVRHPGEFPAGHRYVDRLAMQNPMPIVLLDGTYYYDRFTVESSISGVATVPGGLVRDCVALLSLAPIRNMEKQCGLIDTATTTAECMYTRLGLGCPQLGLSNGEADQREALGFDDWCHWTYATLFAGVAAKDVEAHWAARRDETKTISSRGSDTEMCVAEVGQTVVMLRPDQIERYFQAEPAKPSPSPETGASSV